MITKKTLYITAGIGLALLGFLYWKRRSQATAPTTKPKTPTSKITWVDTGDIQHKSSSEAVKKDNGKMVWDSHAYSKESFTKKASISGTINTDSTTAVLGLITDPDQKVGYDAGWYGTDYFWYFYDEDFRADLGKALDTPRKDPRVECWMFDYATSQAVNLASLGAWQKGENFEVSYDNGVVTYLRNGKAVYIERGIATDKPLHAFVSFQRGGGKGLSDITFTNK